MAVGGILVLFGVIHSPAEDQMFLPTQLTFSEVAAEGYFPMATTKIVVEYAITYLLMAGLIFGYGWLVKDTVSEITTDEEFEALNE